MEEMKGVFQLLPLRNRDPRIKYIPSEAEDCSLAAMSILQVMYVDAEEQIRECKFKSHLHTVS